MVTSPGRGAAERFRHLHPHDERRPAKSTIVASHEKGLTVTDQLRTVARQCYAWTLPYGVSFADDEDVKAGQIVSESLLRRLEMLIRDVKVYGEILGKQRRADLSGKEPGFLARLRKG